MNCPHCEFHFKILASNGAIPRIAPAICENCAELSLVVDGEIRKMTPLESEAIKDSPAYTDFIVPARRIIRAAMKAKNAKNN